MPRGINKRDSTQNRVVSTGSSINWDIKPQIKEITPNRSTILDNQPIPVLEDVAKQINAVANKPLKNRMPGNCPYPLSFENPKRINMRFDITNTTNRMIPRI